MDSVKDDFLNQLQFNLGHRWPDLNTEDIETINDLGDYILKRHEKSNWPFLDFLPIYFSLKNWVQNKTDANVSQDFDLNTLPKAEKLEFGKYINNNFGEPLELRRFKSLRTIVFSAPIVLILLPLLISTYLVTAKEYSGWYYLSALIGLALSALLFNGTQKLKNQYEPASIFEYAKSFFVVHHQNLKINTNRKELIDYLCEFSEAFFGMSFNANSKIPNA